MQSYFNASRTSWHVHGSHKLQCGAWITLQPNHNFFRLIDLMKCKKKTVNQSSKRNTFLTHGLQTIELCLTWTQTQSLLLPAQWPYQRSLKENSSTADLLKRHGACDSSLKEWRWTDLRQPDSWWSHPCLVDTSLHDVNIQESQDCFQCLFSPMHRLRLLRSKNRHPCFQVMSYLWQPKQFSQPLPEPSLCFIWQGFSESCCPWVFSQDVQRSQAHSQTHGKHRRQEQDFFFLFAADFALRLGPNNQRSG